jgi:2-dehydro-3-deoxyphosphogluconate aldolase/(4S)-4-hydroxy-2-oxoglutarate aldolase
MHEIIKKISLIGIVPVIKIEDVDKAVPLAKALLKGGIPVAEVTFRTEQAQEAIARISRELPDMLVGAGTVLTTEQVDKAVSAGAKFIVSPGLNPQVVEYCISKGIPITPGCTNPSDIEMAISLGLDVVKFFPAEASGGIKMIKALSGPFGNIKFMPTGGIDASNLNDYLSFPKVLACGGSWMAQEKLIYEGNFDKIERLAREAMEGMLGFKLAHVGLNCEDEEQAKKIAGEFSTIFNFSLNETNSSVFTGGVIEVMKAPYRGAMGHIAIKTNYIDRAVNYLSYKGFKFDENTAKYDSKGNLKSIYLENEIGGFAIHLV